jgi:ABC-type sugar transport system permease subunit
VKARIGFFAAAVVIMTAAVLLLASGQSSRADQGFQTQRLLAVCRALGWVYLQEETREDEAADGLTDRFAAATKEQVPGLTDLLVLEGTRFLAHTDPQRSGQRLDRDSLADKALYDAGARLKATVGKNIDERERNPDLVGFAYPELEMEERSGGALVVYTPVKDGDRYRALAVVAGSPVASDTSLPWPVLVVTLVALLLFAAAARLLDGVSMMAAGGTLLAIAMGVQAAMLADWRHDLRHSHAALRAETYQQLHVAGLLEAAAPGELDSLVPALALSASGLPAGDLVALGAAGEPRGEVVRFAGGKVAFANRFFEAGHSLDRGHLTRWGLAIGLVAIAVFILGLLGQITRGWRSFKEHRNAYAYLSPAIVGMLILVFIPLTFGLVLGIMKRTYNIWHFAGLENYLEILSNFDVSDSNSFYFKLAVTAMWTFLNVGLHVSIGLFLALLLNDQILKARGVFRVLLIVPWAVPNYITALIWKGMFHKQFGAINGFLAVLGIEPVSWFQTFWTSFFTNLATNVWLGFPFMMVVSLGALQSIPSDLYEAATVDGASRWQRFSRITLPLLMPALVPAVIVGTVWTFNMFNIIYLVSGGAPNGATDILITDAFRWAFERDRYGYAAAYSTLIFVILLLFTLITNRITGATKGAFE